MENHDTTNVVDPVRASTPTMEMDEEFHVLRETRKSLGGEALRPIEIDMDILVDAYPQEAKFLAVTKGDDVHSTGGEPATPKTPSRSVPVGETPGFSSARKTPGRRFFKSELEREYARNLMKELVQIYILQGVHGKDAFRNALNETRRRIHTRRGDPVPSTPQVVSPVRESPYPKLSPPKHVETPYSGKKTKPAEFDLLAIPGRLAMPASSASPERLPPAHPSTPSRVKSLIAAIQSTPSGGDAPKPVRKTPQSISRVKAVAESLEAQISAGTPVKQKPTESYISASVAAVTSPLKAKSPVKPSPAKARTPQSIAKASPVREPAAEPKEASSVRSVRKATVEEVPESARASSRLKKAEPVNEEPIVKNRKAPKKAEEVSTPPKSDRKNQEIVEKASTTRRGRKQAETTTEKAPAAALREESPPGTAKRARRAAAMAAMDELMETDKKTTPGRKKAATATTTTTGRKRKAALEAIPEDEPVVDADAKVARPTRKAKAAAAAVIKK